MIVGIGSADYCAAGREGDLREMHVVAIVEDPHQRAVGDTEHLYRAIDAVGVSRIDDIHPGGDVLSIGRKSHRICFHRIGRVRVQDPDQGSIRATTQVNAAIVPERDELAVGRKSDRVRPDVVSEVGIEIADIGHQGHVRNVIDFVVVGVKPGGREQLSIR